MLLKEYIKKILKENLEFPNEFFVDQEDYIVLNDFLMEKGFREHIDSWEHIQHIKELKRTEDKHYRAIISWGVDKFGDSIYNDRSREIYISVQLAEKQDTGQYEYIGDMFNYALNEENTEFNSKIFQEIIETIKKIEDAVERL